VKIKMGKYYYVNIECTMWICKTKKVIMWKNVKSGIWKMGNIKLIYFGVIYYLRYINGMPLKNVIYEMKYEAWDKYISVSNKECHGDNVHLNILISKILQQLEY
jgi:hypothetical protein